MTKGVKKILLCLPPWTFSVVCIALIIYLTLFPKPLGDMQMSLFPGADKVVHAIMFGGLTFCVMLDMWRKGCLKRLSGLQFAMAMIASIVFGGVIEFIQTSMGLGREGDIWDFMADAAGVLIVGGGLYLIRNYYGGKSQ